MKTYMLRTQNYIAIFSQVKTSKIIAIIGLVLGALSLLWSIYQIVSVGGWDAYMENVQKMVEEMQNQ